MKREPQGIPTGGQFAATARTEPDVELASSGASVWVRIERENSANLMLGPYPDEAAAERAMNSALVDGFCEEDALDCYVDSGAPGEEDEQVIIDLNDPHHTGIDE